MGLSVLNVHVICSIIPIYTINNLYLYQLTYKIFHSFKGVQHLKFKISMFWVISQSYQHMFASLHKLSKEPKNALKF